MAEVLVTYDEEESAWIVFNYDPFKKAELDSSQRSELAKIIGRKCQGCAENGVGCASLMEINGEMELIQGGGRTVNVEHCDGLGKYRV
jgi:hypothetical protein